MVAERLSFWSGDGRDLDKHDQTAIEFLRGLTRSHSGCATERIFSISLAPAGVPLRVADT